MAIDTRQKRRSMIHCRFGWGRMMAPVADGTIGQADRQFIPGRYAGILWNPVGPTDPDARIIRELRIDGDDLIVSFSLVDSSNDAIITAQNISFSIIRLSDSNYYNVATNAFDLASEPSLINAPHVDDGVWEYTLTNGYATKYDNYRIHVEAAGPYTGNYGFVKSLNLDTLLFNNLTYSLILTQSKKLDAILKFGKEINDNEKKIDELYSAIRDMRRDLLRGKDSRR